MASQKELYDRAGELGIANRDTLTKKELQAAVDAAEAKVPILEVATLDHKQKATKAKKEDLIRDVEGEDQQTANAAIEELSKRDAAEKEAERAMQEEKHVKRETPQLYVVTKACVVARDGFLSDLPLGAIVSALTHNLDILKTAGAELAPCKGSKLVYDQFMRAVTVAEL
jgi:hypothetical protein